MNIFVLDEDPIAAARYLCDKHCIKMILESTQILSTVSQQRGFYGPYKITHANHPATKWVALHPANWAWLIKHALYMCSEYTERYGKIHKCEALLQSLADNSSEIWKGTQFRDHSDYYAERTEYVQCMPDEYKRDSAVEAYRAYYRGAKASIARWDHSPRPEWFN